MRWRRRPAGHLEDLAGHLADSFDATGRYDDLAEAIGAARRLLTSDGKDSAAGLANLARLLRMRHDHLGGLDDIDAGIGFYRQALVAPGGAGQPVLLNGLSLVLRLRYDLLSEPRDLAEAITLARAAVASAEPGDRAMCHVNLSLALLRAFQAAGAATDLEEAFEAGELAVAETPTDDPKWPLRACSLAEIALAKPDLRHLEAAIEDLLEPAVRRTPRRHPRRADRELALAHAHYRRFDLLRQYPLVRQATKYALRATRRHNAPTETRLDAALFCAAITAIPDRPQGIRRLRRTPVATFRHWRGAIELLNRLAWRGLARAERERLLRRYPEIAADAAGVALDVGRTWEAVAILERGRAVLWGQMLEMRSDRVLLQRHAPDLVRRMDEVAAELNS